MKDMSNDVSSVLITRRMNATGVYRHFSRWKADEQKKVIQDCGLASSHYGNKAKRIEIISHLLSVDLPLDPGVVLRTIKEQNLPWARFNNRKQFALLLLQHMADGMEITEAPEPAEATTGPSAELLADTARCVLFDRIQPDTSVPWAYRQCDTLQNLWPIRREVCVILSGSCMNQCNRQIII